MAKVVKVKLLEDVAEGGRSLAKACAAADAFGLGKSDPKYPRLKTTTTKRGTIEYRAGLVVSMVEDGAAKWIAAGVAALVK